MRPLQARRALHALFSIACVCLALWAPSAQAQIKNRPDPITLTMQPGCKTDSGSTDLPVGRTDDCKVVIQKMATNSTHYIAFTVPFNTAMSLSISLRSRGGIADMGLYYPGKDPESGSPSVTQSVLYSYSTEQENWIYVDPEALTTPGEYILVVKGVMGSPNVTVSFYTPGPGIQLSNEDAAAIQKLVTTCCWSGEPSVFCTGVVPKAMAAGHNWYDDLCHIPPNRCNAEGHLTDLVLANMGLKCKAFPSAMSDLTALRRLDLSNNDLAQSTFVDMAYALKNDKAINELYLARTNLVGQLECLSPVADKARLDLSYNQITGPLKACLMQAPFQELFLGYNKLQGNIPEVAQGNVARVLYVPHQDGVGLVGSIPTSLLNNPNLRELDVGANNLTGALPALAQTALAYVNVSHNSLTGKLPALPNGMWAADFTGNMFMGDVPDLSKNGALTSFLASDNLLSGSVAGLPDGLLQLELADNALGGALPALPASLLKLDIANNTISGDLSKVDLKKFTDFRAGNNSLTGFPASVADAPQLSLLSLRKNKISGSLPSTWQTPQLQFLVLQDNAITGTIPPALAALPNLGVLRLQNNKLKGGLKDFAAAVPSNSRLFDFNVSSNQLTGDVPSDLGKMGVFNGSMAIILPQADGTTSKATRVMDLADNPLSGQFPMWILQSVPDARQACECPIYVNLGRDNTRLQCPQATGVSDYVFQVASSSRYHCWDGRKAVPVIEYLTSPGTGNTDLYERTWGDGGISPGAPRKLKPAAAAGVAIGVIAGVGLAVGLAFFVRKKVIASRQGATRKYLQPQGDTLPSTSPSRTASGASPQRNRGNLPPVDSALNIERNI